VAQEAAAEYVGGRAGAWWRAFEQLNLMIACSDRRVERLGDIRARYEADMAKSVFRYSEEGRWFSKEQEQTTRPIAHE
jgi:hypothetical protein